MRCCQRRRCRPAALLLILVLLTNILLLTACGGVSDASMHLKQTEGTVYVTNKNGRTRQAERGLVLYSGYHVSTQAKSQAWIGPDKEKQIKLAQNSEIEILQEKQSLTVSVISGSLFFNVSEPSSDEETVEICTSSIQVGTRGSCGWVNVPDAHNI